MGNRLSISAFTQSHTDGLGEYLYTDANLTIICNVKILPFWNQIAQLDFALVVFCKGGKLEATLNDTNYAAKEGDLLFCSGLHTVTEAMLSTDFVCDLFLISIRKYQETIVPDKETMYNFLFAYKSPLITLSRKELSLVECYKKLLKEKTDEDPTCYTQRTIDSLTQALIFEFMSACERRKDNTAIKTGNNRMRRNIAHDFLLLLSEDACQHRNVAYFADKMCITPKYLTHVVRQETGKTVSQWIKEQLTEQIRNLLLNTSLSCKEIATRLGFSNNSFFGKYTKEHLGCSPMQFRAKKL
ncbi:MAG: helix-turn-helix domain-containing protein [Prevotella sp.]